MVDVGQRLRFGLKHHGLPNPEKCKFRIVEKSKIRSVLLICSKKFDSHFVQQHSLFRPFLSD